MRSLVLLWLLAALGGTGALVHYSAQPGELGDTPAQWPAELAEVLSAELPTALMLVHPGCACSKASLREFERLLSKFPDKLNALVFFSEPKNFPKLQDEKLWRRANAIAGLKVVRDKDGERAKLFDSKTSGQVVLYDQSGELVFSGGLTSARGHEGLSPGRLAIEKYLSSSKSDSSRSSVYGCELLDKERQS